MPFLLLLLLLPLVGANGYLPVDVWKHPDALSYLSSSWPLAAVLKSNQPFIEHSQAIVDHLKRYERVLSNPNGTTKAHSEISRCNLNRPEIFQWSIWAMRSFEGRQWEPLPPFSCITQFTVVDNKLLEAIHGHAEELHKHAGDIAKKADVDWPHATAVSREKIETRNTECEVSGVGAVRMRNYLQDEGPWDPGRSHWYLLSRVTNERERRNMAVGERMYIEEAVRVEDGKLWTGDIWQRFNDSGELKNGTTGLLRIEGEAGASTFGLIYAEENEAVLEALGRVQRGAEQAEEARTKSNIAILALPLVMNLVPIALITEVKTVRMLLYACLGDVLVVLPMGIKGVELLVWGGRKVGVTVTRMTSRKEEGTALSAVAEVWGGSCVGKVGDAGWWFLFAAVFALIVGLGGEIWAWRWAKRKRKYVRKYGDLDFLDDGWWIQRSRRDDGMEVFEDEAGWRETKKSSRTFNSKWHLVSS